LLRKIDCAALKAVYIAQPRTIANPATCSVRFNSVRRTCRNLATMATSLPVGRCAVPASGLLDGGDPFQRGDSLFDRRVGVEEVVEEAAVVLGGVIDAHRRHRIVELRRGLSF